MNIKQLEAQAKVLAPVIKGFVDRAVEMLRGEFAKALKSTTDTMESTLDQRIDAVKQAIPSLDTRELLDAAQVRALLDEERAKYKAAVAEECGVLSGRLADLLKQMDAHAQRAEALQKSLESLENAEKFDPEAAKTLFSGLISEHEAALKSAAESARAAAVDVAKDEIGAVVAGLAVRVGECEAQAKAAAASETFSEGAAKALIAAQIERLKAEFLTENDAKTLIYDGIQAKFAAVQLPKDGEPGKDALQIEILPGIDFDKSYPRNTYALHNGGVMRAYQQTQGEKGWETALNGIAGVEIEQKNSREVVVKVVQTNGKAQETVFAVPAMVYRGIFKDGEPYLQGDTTTYGGSLWHADANDPPGKPGQEKSGWTLIAKKGRDGK